MKKGKAILGNLILIIIIILIVGVFGYYFWKNNKPFVPENFIEARSKSSVIASDLVSNLDNSLKSLDKISEEDRNYNYSAALDLVNQESDKIENVRTKSLDLSGELIKMAQAVQGIKPANARNLAFEAVTQEVPLIEHVMNYNSYFVSLLDSLRLKFINDGSYRGGEEVQHYINNMNREASEINSANESFNQKLKEFDGSVK